MNKVTLFFIFFALCKSELGIGKVFAQDLNDLIALAYKNNPGIAAVKKIAEAEESLISSSFSFDDPIIGVSTIDRNVKTHYGTITQKFRFPVKYYLQARIQKGRADSKNANIELEKSIIRQQVISLYFSIYSTQKIILLTKANIQAVREFARVAEKKYAAGKSTQSDSMKAHFELTQLELDLIRLKQEEASLQGELRAILKDDHSPNLDISKRNLSVPVFQKDKISDSLNDLNMSLRQSSPQLKTELNLLEVAKGKSTLAKWEFAPDFQIQYQQRLAGHPSDSKIYSIGITFPLWFWKKGSEASAASSYKMAQEYKVTNMSQKLIAKVQDLKEKASAGEKTLQIYKTSLIPQAQSAYNSTRSSYRANKTSFLDLLDSERSLYRVKTGFYKSLEIYIKNITQLESHMGFTISNIEN